MVEINLLPFRKQRSFYEIQSIKKYLAGSFLLSLLLAVLLHVGLVCNTTNLKENVALLQDKIQNNADLLHEIGEIKRHNEIDRQWLESALKFQKFNEKLIHRLIESPLENICFNQVFRENNNLIFVGFARSIEDLTKFLLHWRANNLFSEIKIENLYPRMESHFVKFKFQAIEKNRLLVQPESIEKENTDATL